jgi:GntR family transcriptional regulator, transcriptional repressor for pyruvate dehydrogenase complex
MQSNPMVRVARSANLSEVVSRDLETRIRSGEFRPGSQMPSEKQLGTMLGVSRPVVREAVARLKADGFVETRQGAGMFVTASPGLRDFRVVIDAAARDEIGQLLELRKAVEVAAAELAAQRRTEDDLKAIRETMERMDTAIRDRGDGIDADDAFHAAVAGATHNPYLRRFIMFLGHHFSDTRRYAWTEEGHRQGMPRDAQREHERIFAAIAAGDGRRARDAAAAHLQGSAARQGLDINGTQRRSSGSTRRARAGRPRSAP